MAFLKIGRWFRSVLPATTNPARRKFSVRLNLEALETRVTPSLFTVTSTGDSDADTGSLRYALDNARAQNITLIDFAPSVRSITLNTANQTGLVINSNLSIFNDQGVGPVTINGAGTFTVFTVNDFATASLSGLTITNGGNNLVGGIENRNNLVVNNCTFSGNSGVIGGIDNNDTLTVNDSVFIGNSASDIGGGIFNEGISMVVSGCTFSENSAGNRGGGIDDLVGATISDSTLVDNTISSGTEARGAGLSIAGNPENGSVIVNGDIIAGNFVSSNELPSDIAFGAADPSSSDNLIGTGGSGGLTQGMNGNQVGVSIAQVGLAPLGYYGGPTETLALLPGSIAIGKGLPAGLGVPATDQRGFARPINGQGDVGAFQFSASLVVNTTIDDALGDGPGQLSLRDAVALADVDSTITPQPITFDPAVFAAHQTIFLSAGALTLGSAAPPPGSAAAPPAPITITAPSAGVTIDGMGASQVFNVDSNANTVLSDLTIAHGRAVAQQGPNVTGGGGSGGGIENDGTLTVNNSTFLSNSAIATGGGIDNDGILTVWDSTFFNNSAQVGAGINNNGILTLVDSTLSGNAAFTHGGGLANAATATLNGDVVAGNLNGGMQQDDIAGTVNSASSNNAIGTGGSGGLTKLSNGNKVGLTSAQIGLAPFGFYGGPTKTFALLPGSLALGAGLAAGAGVPADDQRGFARPVNGQADAGAFQFSDALIVNTTADDAFTALGQLSLRDAVNLANVDSTTTAEPISFSPTVFAAPQTIFLNSDLVLVGTTAPINITGPAANLAIDGGGRVTPFLVLSGVHATFSNLTIAHGYGDMGGGISSAGNLILNNCNLFANSASSGGGAFNGVGGILTINGGTFQSNTAVVYGGGVYNQGALGVSGTAFSANTATLQGGAIENETGGTATIGGVAFSANSAMVGGAVFNANQMSINNSTFSVNSAQIGGAVDNFGVLTIVAGSFVYNFANQNGGGLTNTGTTTLTSCTFFGNLAHAGGGGVANIAGRLSVVGGAFTSNGAATYGGGIYNNYGQLTVSDAAFSGNAAGLQGGAVENDVGGGNVTIGGNSTFTGNVAKVGGGVFNASALAVTNSIFSGNIAQLFGACIATMRPLLAQTGDTFSGDSPDEGVINF